LANLRVPTFRLGDALFSGSRLTGGMAAPNEASSDGLVVARMSERQVADEHKCHVKSFERVTQL